MPLLSELSQIKKILNIFKDFSSWVSKNKLATVFGVITIAILIFLTLGALFLYYKVVTPLQTLAQKESVFVSTKEDINIGKKLNESINKNNLIDSVLKELLVIQGSDRAYLFLFHNGTVGVNGDHFFYMSNTNEVVTNGTSPEMVNLQRQPLSMINDWNVRFNKGECVSADVHLLSNTDTKKIVLQRQGIKKLGVCPVFQKTYLVGFIGVDYTNSEKENFNIDTINDYSKHISTILSTH
jgi:hypothetical protein